MRRLHLLSAAILTLAACKGGEKPAPTPPPPPPPPMAFVTVIYNIPKDAKAFEKYYWETHIPLVNSKAAEIGFTAAELTKFDATLDGKAPTYYRQAVLWFPDMAALEKGTATAGFKAVGDDLANFATGGLTAMVGEQTNDASPLLSGDTTAFVTVIYNHPKDAAAFESYYADTHLPLVGKGAAEMAFTRAELTRFARNLDGTPAAFYRQAKLYWPSGAALTAGTGTGAFKAVGDDLGNFADGGLVALVGHLTSAP
ncbi:MAG: EthD family reductase [Gemmatimonadota bacterium]|nr:EthD family reductase [Gemmatimonadota bacterium]